MLSDHKDQSSCSTIASTRVGAFAIARISKSLLATIATVQIFTAEDSPGCLYGNHNSQAKVNICDTSKVNQFDQASDK